MEKRQCVVVVDDEKEILKMLGRALELEGYDVSLAANGTSVLTLLHKHKPDLVILYISTRMNGSQVLDLIRQPGPSRRVHRKAI